MIGIAIILFGIMLMLASIDRTLGKILAFLPRNGKGEG